MYEGTALITLINEVQILTYHPEVFDTYESCTRMMNFFVDFMSERYGGFIASIIPECLPTGLGV